MELQTIKTEGIEKFEQLQKSVNDQVSVLSAIEVTDETSEAIANQQLSKAKKLENFIDDARLLIQEKEFKFCKEVNKKAGEIAIPLTTSMAVTKNKLKEWDKTKKANALQKTLEIQAAQQKIEQDRIANQAAENEKTLLLQVQVAKFEGEAFKAINDAKTMEDLSAAFVKFVQSMPVEMGLVVQGRIKSLGVAKKNLILAPESGQAKFDIQTAYNQTYATVTGTEVKIEAKIIEAPVEAVNYLKQQEQAVAIQSAPTNIRKSWAWEVQNICDVPLEWLKIDEDMVKEFMKTEKESLTEGMVYNGVKFYQKETVVIK